MTSLWLLQVAVCRQQGCQVSQSISYIGFEYLKLTCNVQKPDMVQLQVAASERGPFKATERSEHSYGLMWDAILLSEA